jgi:hypothetical protein
MEPISMSTAAQSAFGNQEPPIPAAPDATDVQEFQNLYNQDAGFGPAAAEHHGASPIQNMLMNLTGNQMPGAVSDNVFQAAMERMVELHEHSCAKIETLIDRIADSASMSPAEMLEAQVSLADATTGLATYQSFDKKTDEGIKALMTGQ